MKVLFIVEALLGGFRDTGYSRRKLPGYEIFEEKFIGIQDIEK